MDYEPLLESKTMFVLRKLGYSICMVRLSDVLDEKRGFTVVEMIVVLAIVLLIGGQILVDFGSLNEASTLNRAAQELAFNIRRAQNMSLAVTGVKIGGVIQIPDGVGLRLSSQTGSNDSYFFFADQDCPGAGCGLYTGAMERIEPNIMLPGRIRITAITGVIPAQPSAHIIFYTPEATLILTNELGVPILGTVMDITLSGASGATKHVRIRTSGLVRVF